MRCRKLKPTFDSAEWEKLKLDLFKSGMVVDTLHVYFEVNSYNIIQQVRLSNIEIEGESSSVSTTSIELDYEGYEPDYEGGGVIGEDIFYTLEEAERYVYVANRVANLKLMYNANYRLLEVGSGDADVDALTKTLMNDYKKELKELTGEDYSDEEYFDDVEEDNPDDANL